MMRRNTLTCRLLAIFFYWFTGVIKDNGLMLCSKLLERKLKKLKGYIDNEEIVWFYRILAWEMEKVVYCHRKKGMYPNAVHSVRLAKNTPFFPGSMRGKEWWEGINLRSLRHLISWAAYLYDGTIHISSWYVTCIISTFIAFTLRPTLKCLFLWEREIEREILGFFASVKLA